MSRTDTTALREALAVARITDTLRARATAELETLERGAPPVDDYSVACSKHGWNAAFGCEICIARVRARFPEFPLQTNRQGQPGPVSVPWVVAERAWARYSQLYGRDQSVEHLAQRGGFSWGEMDDLFPGWRGAVDEWVNLRRQLADAQRDASANAHEVESLRASLRQVERERDEARRALAEAATRHNEVLGATLADLEHCRSVMGKALTEERAAREQAERERDEARAALKRAASNNAALLEELESIHTDDPYVVSDTTLAKYRQGSGAALLERHRVEIGAMEGRALSAERRAADLENEREALLEDQRRLSAIHQRAADERALYDTFAAGFDGINGPGGTRGGLKAAVNYLLGDDAVEPSA